MPLFIFWIIFLLGLELNFIGKLLVFRWELIVLLLLQICFFFCYERDFMWKSGWHYWGFQFIVKIHLWFIKYWQYLVWPNGGPDIPYITPKSSDTEAFFLDLNLCISNGTVSTKIYDKRDNFDFDIVNFPFLGVYFPPAYLIWGIHISTY